MLTQVQVLKAIEGGVSHLTRDKRRWGYGGQAGCLLVAGCEGGMARNVGARSGVAWMGGGPSGDN